MRTTAFCFVCGSKTRMAYPGNDPENGPATLRCQKDPDHESLDEVESEAIAEAEGDIIDNFLSELLRGQRHTVLDSGPQYVTIPASVKAAAKTLQDDRQKESGLAAAAAASSLSKYFE